MNRTLITLLALAALASPVARADEDAALAPDDAPSLRLYGFADFGYFQPFLDGDNSWTQALSTHGNFTVGNLNLYLDGHLGERARSLVEVRFTYLPNGAAFTLGSVPGVGPVLVTNGTTFVADPARSGLAGQSWGGIIVERAFAEYTLDQLLTIRAGQFLTPYGIWNVDHGSPAIVGLTRPYVINAQIIPERQMGLEAYGSRYAGNVRLGWHLTLSNGRNESSDLADPARPSMPQTVDYDGKLGYGGRIFAEAETRLLGTIRVGASAYTGRFTAMTTFVPLLGSPSELSSRITRQFDERSFGADLQVERSGVLLQAEGVWQDYEYTRADPTNPGGSGGRSGAYVLVGVRLPREIMPFVMGQFYDPNHRDSDSQVWGGEAGLNVRIQPNLVAKASYSYYAMPNAPAGSIGEDPVGALMTQVAWLF